MFKLLKIYLTLILMFNVAFTLGYNTVILLEFENISQSKSSDYLRHMLPDIIKDHNLNHDVSVEYAGKIEPYLGLDNTKYRDALIVLGKFSLNQFKVDIEIDIYDISTWTKIDNFYFSCMGKDDVCFEKNMTYYSLNSLQPLFLSKEAIKNFNEHEMDNSVVNNNSSINNLYESLGNFAIEADLNNTWSKLYDSGSQYGNRYYKDIDRGQYKNVIENSRERNTEKLISFINDILLNPYDVSIQNISMDYDNLNNQYINIRVPVTYLVKKSFIEDILTTLPNDSRSYSNGKLIIKFSKSDFIFSSSIIDRFALMEYQVLPVIFLSDNFGRVNYIHIDSWKKDYQLSNVHNSVSISMSNEFFPLFAITPGESNMQINLDMTALDIIYDFRVPASDIQEYSKIAIKFLYDNEVESILNKLHTIN